MERGEGKGEDGDEGIESWLRSPGLCLGGGGGTGYLKPLP